MNHVGSVISRCMALSMLVAGMLCSFAAQAAEQPKVAAASDLKFAMPALIADFTAQGGVAPQVTFGSSGLLAHQIENGAPFELYLSADEAYVGALTAKGLTLDHGRLYALGRVVVFAPETSAVAVDATLSGLRSALDAHSVRHIAIANPDHAPYGRAAVGALEKAQLLDKAQTLFVKGENVAQALQFAIDGGADVALVSHSLVGAKGSGVKGRYAVLDEIIAAPLRQKMVLMKNASAPARAFYDYLNGDRAQAILADYGFSPPLDP